jgi:hypothetical protein
MEPADGEPRARKLRTRIERTTALHLCHTSSNASLIPLCLSPTNERTHHTHTASERPRRPRERKEGGRAQWGKGATIRAAHAQQHPHSDAHATLFLSCACLPCPSPSCPFPFRCWAAATKEARRVGPPVTSTRPLPSPRSTATRKQAREQRREAQLASPHVNPMAD